MEQQGIPEPLMEELKEELQTSQAHVQAIKALLDRIAIAVERIASTVRTAA